MLMKSLKGNMCPLEWTSCDSKHLTVVQDFEQRNGMVKMGNFKML